MSTLSLAQAQVLVRAALDQAAADYKRPICVAVCDAAGFLIAFARQDRAPFRSIAISEGKAYSAARMGTNTDAFLERLERENVQASYFCDSKLTALPGGAVLKDDTGAVIGGAGISGLTAAEDQVIANRLAEMTSAPGGVAVER
jgi:uncharacterized protein GlcG (DUF336 family)